MICQEQVNKIVLSRKNVEIKNIIYGKDLILDMNLYYYTKTINNTIKIIINKHLLDRKVYLLSDKSRRSVAKIVI